MSQADELLKGLTEEQISLYAGSNVEEPQIIIGRDRFITVPESLKRIAVEHDHNIETVTFRCPRYWDEHDLSQMILYINYKLSNGYIDSYVAENVTVVDEETITFTWTISRNVTQIKGNLIFLVCAKSTKLKDDEALEILHWNTELCTDVYVSEGLEADPTVEEEYPDIVTQLLERMTNVENIAVKKAEMDTVVEQATQASQQAFDSSEEVKNSASEIRNSYANAIKGKVSGEIVRVDDVSPLEHDVDVFVHGKNLVKIDYVNGESSTDRSVIQKDGDTIIFPATDGNLYGIYINNSDLGMKVGKTYTASIGNVTAFDSASYGWRIRYADGSTAVLSRALIATFTPEKEVEKIIFRIGSPYTGNAESIITGIQIEEGSVATEYEPYIDPSSISVSVCGKNIFPYPFDGTAYENGITFANNNGSVTLNGINNGTSNSVFYIAKDAYITLPAGTYSCSPNLEDISIMGVEKGGGYHTFCSINKKQFTLTEPTTYRSIYIQIPKGTTKTFSNVNIRPMLEYGSTEAIFESYVDKPYTYESNGHGTAKSINPTMTIFTDTPGVTVEAEYNRDTTKVLENLEGDKGDAGTVDQTYSPTSENAQSGKAVSEAFGIKALFDGELSQGYWDTDNKKFEIIPYSGYIASTNSYPCTEGNSVKLKYAINAYTLGIAFFDSENQMCGYSRIQNSNTLEALAPKNSVKCVFHIHIPNITPANAQAIYFGVGDLLLKHDMLLEASPIRFGKIVTPNETLINITDTEIRIPSLTRLFYGNGKTYRTSGNIYVKRVATSTSDYSEEILVFNENTKEFRFIGGNAFAECDKYDIIIATFKNGLNGNSLPLDYANAKSEEETADENTDVTNAIIQAHKVPSVPENTTTNLGLVHFSDIHADTDRLKNILRFSEKHANYIDDVVCTGDMSPDIFDNSYDWWANTSGSEKILVAIGNHDRWDGTPEDFTYPGASEAECYAKYIQPFCANWGAVHSDSHTYYYKDYSSQKIRLVVMDCMLNETTQVDAQNSWLSSVLAGAKTNGYGVVIMTHYIPYKDDLVEVECNFTSVKQKNLDPDGFNSTYQETVQDFINGGGDFICYLAGHIHLDLVIKNKDYPDQWFIAVDTANTARGHSYGDTDRIVGTKCENLFNYITFNTEHKLVKIVRVGADMDCYLRSKKTLVFNYQTKEILSQN